jgi:hypothetical protein
MASRPARPAPAALPFLPLPTQTLITNQFGFQAILNPVHAAKFDMPWTSFKLNNGHKIPGIAFGSAGHSDDVTPDVIDTAIEVGFDHIDTAQSRFLLTSLVIPSVADLHSVQE